mgnify:CR=1 FL=1
MNVSLSPQLDAYVRDLVQEGDYRSASEVVREGLRLLKEKQTREAETRRLRGLMEEALESGPAVPFDGDRIRERLLSRAAELRGEG